ncbi:33 kDa ribonucleoprotein, chloroplastic [Benincasa hispida]|uniref:33 kDa ribonucleoprotein, chloroplastic n=1 Tax=Benincasa hispida TaxID=102211 RepID=UPI00190093B8|nr:33 kDa ribonucleoprotein, chloroplastic [Benincasa hispida]
MSASSVSMAAAAAPSVSSSSPLSKKLFFTQHPNQIPSHFSPKQNPLKLLNLTIHLPNFYPLSFSSPSHLHSVPPAFDGLEVSDPETEYAEIQESDAEEETQEEDEQKVSVSREAGKLYIGNLPYAMTSSQLSEVFAEAGHVVSVQVIYDKVTDRSRGFAFVTMATLEEAKEAIRMFDGSQIGGRTVRVNFPEVPRGGEKEVMGPKIRSSYNKFVDSPHKIYAGNLGWGLTSQSLREAFENQPGILSAKVIYDRASGKSRGFGFVSFETAEDAEFALESMNGVEVEGRPLRLNIAAGRAPTSPAAFPRTENTIDSKELLTSISA